MSDLIKVIGKKTVKRLAKDVAEIIKNPLTDNGIFYIHSDNNWLIGYACIVGPPNTPYEGGYYFFEFIFPTDYPDTPPKVIYHTNDGVTRFNPNLYRNGKVCLSILNTWRGPQWTGCQTISSILLCLCGSVLTDSPLINEPGINNDHADFENYNKILTFKNYEVAVIDMLTRKDISDKFNPLIPLIKEHFKNNYNNLIKNIKKNKIKNNIIINTSIYNMSIKISYSNIKERIDELYKSM